jgi:hypothetical protein
LSPHSFSVTTPACGAELGTKEEELDMVEERSSDTISNLREGLVRRIQQDAVGSLYIDASEAVQITSQQPYNKSISSYL